MAEAFALAASVAQVVGFALQLWTDSSEIRKSGSTISTADCVREAASLKAYCDRVKLLQDVETELVEAKRIKEIAIEIRTVAEELSSRLAKCEYPAGQKGWKRYHDVVSAVWHGMQLHPDAQMHRLGSLRNELQSGLLVSMLRKVDVSDIRSSVAFQKLDGDVKALTEAFLEGKGLIKKAIDDLDAAVEVRHKQVMAKLDRLDPELCNRLLFDGMVRRHYAITVAHSRTFEWIFTGQKKTAESNTTLMEWIVSADNGLYWVSGRAGTGKSSLMRFLDDDPRTKPAFQEWAGERPLLLASFHFWNSEAAGDGLLKSLSGLYRGILYRLIENDDKLAEMLCRVSRSPHLKVIVTSRPENAFEIVSRGSTKLRLHQLTKEDRRTYTSEKLKAVPRFATIATDEEQSSLIHLVVQRSEGIFLWVHLAVESLIQEIGTSLDIETLRNVVKGIPSGSADLARVFDHILRNRLPIETRLLGYRLIRTIQYGMMKLYNPNKDDSTEFLTSEPWDIWRFTEAAMRIARKSEEDDVLLTEKLLDAMDETVTEHYNLLPERPWSVDTQKTQEMHWSEYFHLDSRHFGVRKPGDGRCCSFLSFAVEQGLFRYVESKLRAKGRNAVAKPGVPLLSSAYSCKTAGSYQNDPIRPETVKLLLEYGADPNEDFEGESPWQAALIKVIKLLLDAGADPYSDEQIELTCIEPEKRDQRIHAHKGKAFLDGELTKEEAQQIIKLGEGLLILLEKKKKSWKVLLPHKTKELKGRLKEALSGKKIRRESGWTASESETDNDDDLD
ncbi:hypothetical protein B0H63DRAFT_559023 [Podospora didyma]|uniref:Nephrocystin 3-like N-terminal domain-containing protein n=1 Tax=Podospora didyma TaxID=330526 RepID=A0AAE0U1V7_9PEZI|nr:hypothetical protein B0H63DRAFT_559023 [Podospora didyma]